MQAELKKKNSLIYGLIHLMIVYIIWGSTYLAMRIGVMPSNGFPPFWLGGTRLLTAGIILFLYCRFRGYTIQLGKKDFMVAMLAGAFLWVGGHGIVLWCVQYVDSGYCALFAASTPIFAALIQSIIEKKIPSFLLIFSLLTAFLGIFCLSAQEIKEPASLVYTLILLSAPIFWALGAMLIEHYPLKVNSLVNSAYQQMAGALGLLLLALALGEPLPQPNAAAWGAWVYLLIFGSLIAYTSFIIIFKTLPMSIAMTYAYVNPVIALFLGWLILSEPIGASTIGGTLLILSGVAGIFWEKYHKPK